MRLIFISLLMSGTLNAEPSRIIPLLSEAIALWESTADEFPLRPDLRAAISKIRQYGLDPANLQRLIDRKHVHLLRGNDKFDNWVFYPESTGPEIAVHAVKFEVIEDSDDWFNDDIYVYFFITDGATPSGKVTSTYKGIDEGESFFFNELDRIIYPLGGAPVRKPLGHLIIDYGIIESDGDDVKELRKLSAFIFDLVAAVYAVQDAHGAGSLLNLRKEVAALTDVLFSLDHDDRLATGTLGLRNSELSELLKDQTYVEVIRRHKGRNKWGRWEYRLRLRILR